VGFAVTPVVEHRRVMERHFAAMSLDVDALDVDARFELLHLVLFGSPALDALYQAASEPAPRV
jgi:hypothetical protein